jgi:hypothetical protein
MNDENEPFERQLSRQPLRPAPAEWREDILRAARQDGANERVESARQDWFAMARGRLMALFWPNPKAWAGLAAVWVVMALMNFSIRDPQAADLQLAEKPAPASPQVAEELKSQRQLFAELAGLPEVSDADRPKNIPSKPRSEWSERATI